MLTDLQYVSTFIKVVEYGSFSKAAEKLNVSKSVVSKHVSALEEILQTQLMKRTTRKLILTDTGQTYYQQVKSIPEQLSNAKQLLLPYDEKPKGILKVMTPENYIYTMKQHIVPEFLSKYPEVTLQLDFKRPIKNHVNDDFDIIILWKFSQLSFPDYNLIPVKMHTTPIYTFATPQYLKKYGTPKKPDDLLQHNCLASVNWAWPFKKNKGKLSEIHVKSNLICKNDDVIKQATLSDAGVCYSYPALFEQEIKNGEVVKILKDYTHQTIDFYAFYHPTPYQPLKIKAFVEILKRKFSSDQ